MNRIKKDEHLWFNKYRPTTVQECILPVEIKQIFQNYVDSKQIQHLIMFGKPGIGKTTIAYALAEQIGADLLYIDASSESGIDMIRTKVTQFCSTMSLEGNLKIILLDEADRLSQAAREALRPIFERFSKGTRFILTGNNKSGISEAIDSRCATIDFTIPKKETPKLAAQFLKRLKFILDSENVSYDDKVLVELIMRHFPNYRKIINEVQKYASSGTIDVGILSTFSNDSFHQLVGMIKEKRFTDARTWVNDNSDIEPGFFYKQLYENCSKVLEPSSIPELVLILAKYQYQAAFALDQEINSTAAIVELMSSMRFK